MAKRSMAKICAVVLRIFIFAVFALSIPVVILMATLDELCERLELYDLDRDN